MKEKLIRKHVTLASTHFDILDQVMKEVPGITNYSLAVRYVIQCFADQKLNDSESNQKLNQVAKNVDMLIEMVAGGFSFQDVNSIRPAKETFIYQDAKRHVEKEIQRSTTIKSNHRSHQKKDTESRESVFKL